MGDSYASGIGAGVRRGQSGDLTCSRYTEAYGEVMQVVIDGPPYDPASRQFAFIACSGETSTEMLSTQVPNMDPKVDMATITVGGNDIGFKDLLWNCIFLFGGFGSQDCSDQITESTGLINNNLPGDLDKLFPAILAKAKNSWFKLYITGYAQFFNAVTTPCNNVSFNFWEEKPENLPNLTTTLRTSFNNMADQLNGQIKDAVARANAKDIREPIIFVDYDDLYGGHRYCDVGIKEPDLEDENRWFQENWLFEQHAPYSGANDSQTFLNAANSALQSNSSLRLSTYWTNITGIKGGQVSVSDSSWHWIFDALARAFHPTIDGQDGIKNAVLAAYSSDPPKVANATVAANSSTPVVATPASTLATSTSKAKVTSATLSTKATSATSTA